MTAYVAPLLNHVIQSTGFAAFAALVTLLLRRNGARVRFAVWLAASVKFLVPFSLFVSLGHWIPFPHSVATSPAVYRASEQLTQTLTVSGLLSVPSQPAEISFPWIAMFLSAIWLTGVILVARHWIVPARHIRRLLRHATAVPISFPVPVWEADGIAEPGIFGIICPVLLLPRSVADTLCPEELGAVLAHEWCHVQRRDNLTAALHTVVQSLFWFHPFVWWIGSKLVEEREQACDEAVIRDGNSPESYASGILRVCRMSFESSSPACVAGVTSAGLKQRINAILSGHLAVGLSATRKAILVMAAGIAVIGPLTLGILRTQYAHAQDQPRLHFDVATVKPTNPNERGMHFNTQPGGRLSGVNMTLKNLISSAYGLAMFQISGGPSWIDSDHFDFEAKSDEEAGFDFRSATDAQREQFHQRHLERLRSLLEDRFRLVVRQETREMPVYALVVAKGGPKLTPAKDGSPDNGSIHGRLGVITATGVPMQLLANNMAIRVNRLVIDETGLQGKYDWKLEWTMDQPLPNTAATGDRVSAANPPDTAGPSLSDALEQQLGLKLQARKAQAPILVVVSAAKPSAN